MTDMSLEGTYLKWLAAVACTWHSFAPDLVLVFSVCARGGQDLVHAV